MKVVYSMTAKAGINVISWRIGTLKVTRQALLLRTKRVIINQGAGIIRVFMA
jgi:hypothetical protein